MNDNYFEDNFDLKSVLDEEGIDYSENHKHIFIKECPHCFKVDKLNVDKKSKLWICWYCSLDEGEGKGNLWTLLLSIGFDEFQVKQLFKGKKYHKYTDDFKLEKMEWQNFEDSDENTKEVVQTIIPKWLIYLDRSEEQIRRFPEVYSYLWSRFVRTKEQYQHFLLYFDAFKQRVVFPAITKEHQCIGLQSRDITNRNKYNHPKCTNPLCDMRYHYYFVGEEVAPENCPECEQKLEESFYPKSLNTANFAKTEFFFNEQNIDWAKPVVLVEGPFDSINVPNSMAFLGKFLSDTQFNIIIKMLPPLVVLYMDGDSSGDKSTVDIYNQLRPFVEIKMIFVEDNDDPGSHDTEYNKEKVTHCINPQEWYQQKGLVYM